MDKINILWVDDEIDLLNHIYFPEEKGYEVITASNGTMPLGANKKNIARHRFPG